MPETPTALRAMWLCAAMTACQPSPAEPTEQAAQPNTQGQAAPATLGQSAAPASGWLRSRVPWGQGAGQLSMVPAGLDRVATGPSALAMTPAGAALVLDRLAGRVVRVDLPGGAHTIAEVPIDAEDLSANATGAFVAFSPVRATAWIYDAAGAPAGQLAVPRIFRELSGIGLGPSRVLTVQTAYQEQIDIGSPSAPLPLAVAMKTRREGAVVLPGGGGVQAQVQHEQAEILVVSQPNAEAHTTVMARFTLPGAITAARVVGAAEQVICARLEHVDSAPELTVTRRALCLDSSNGDTLLDEALPPVGAYVPRRDMAMGGGYLGFMHPTPNGLELWRIPVTRLAAAHAEVQP